METPIFFSGYVGDIYGNNGKENGNYHILLGLYWRYIGIVKKKMETTIMGLYGSNRKENGNYYVGS